MGARGGPAPGAPAHTPEADLIARKRDITPQV